MSQLGTVIGDGLRVRNNCGSYDSQLLHSSTSSKKHHSMHGQSRMSKAPESQPQLAGKLSFSNVAHQILSNNSSCDKKNSGAPSNAVVFENFTTLQQQQEQQQATLAGRNGNKNFANYKSVQQTGKQRRGSMYKD